MYFIAPIQPNLVGLAQWELIIDVKTKHPLREKLLGSGFSTQSPLRVTLVGRWFFQRKDR
jgi:hypothetical protein